MEDLRKNILYSNLGQRIKNVRNSTGLNQEDFARLFDLTRSSIVNIERGKHKPSLHLLYDIAYKANISVSELVVDLLPEINSQEVLNTVKIINKEGVESHTIDKITEFISKEIS